MNTAWAQTTTTQVQVNTDAWDAILAASPVVQLTLVLLVVLSVLCWAVGYAKYKQFKTLKEANEPFLNRFWKADSLDSIYEDLDEYEDSSCARMFKAGYQELQKLAESNMVDSSEDGTPPKLTGIDNLERVLRKAMDHEIAAMESRLPILATTGSTSPFIGLFGTVWGIMGSFHMIGATGNASLAVVAPGISEALVATAIGLAAAIPAVMLYNHYMTQTRRQEHELNNFSYDFINVVKRNFFRSE